MTSRDHLVQLTIDQVAALITALVTAPASGRYPNLAAAFAVPGPPPRESGDILGSCVMRLIDGALAG